MGAFRFLHRWTALVQPDDELADVVPLLEDRDRELEDYLAGFSPVSFSPTIKFGGTEVTLSDGVATGEYVRVGPTLVEMWWEFKVGASTTVPAGEMTVSFPVTARETVAAQEMGIGTAVAYDASTPAAYSLIASYNATTHLRLFKSWVSADTVTDASPFAFATTDSVGGYCRYFAATGS